MERTLNSKLFYLVILNTTCGKLWAIFWGILQLQCNLVANK